MNIFGIILIFLAITFSIFMLRFAYNELHELNMWVKEMRGDYKIKNRKIFKGYYSSLPEFLAIAGGVILLILILSGLAYLSL